MLDTLDNHCKIIEMNSSEKRSCLNALLYVNIDMTIAKRLLSEKHLEVRKFKSGKPLMEDCAVVKCSEGRFWNIPREILEGVIKP